MTEVQDKSLAVEKIALVDMDGTIANYDAAMIRDQAKLAAPHDPPFVPHDKAPDYIEARRHMISTQPGWWENLEPIESGLRIVNFMRQVGFNIHILTKGPSNKPNAWAEKVSWVRKYVPDAKMSITEDKGLVYGTVLFDDYVPYVERWLEWRPRGLAIMPLNHHNKDFDHPNVVHFDGKTESSYGKTLKRIAEAFDR